MLLSEKYKILFIEIPKTASTVVGSALNNILGKKNVLHILDRFDNTKYNHVYRHCPINNAFLDFPESKEYFKFCFVRNPWDKMVSMWRYMERHTFLSYVNSKSFTGFARRKYSFWDKNSGSNLNEYVEINKLIPDKLTFDAFLLYIFDSEMKVIFESGSSFSKNADFIGKYENLKNDFDFICDKLKLPRTNLDVANKSDRNKDYRVYYNNRTRDLVGDAFSEDIINFNYSF